MNTWGDTKISGYHWEWVQPPSPPRWCWMQIQVPRTPIHCSTAKPGATSLPLHSASCNCSPEQQKKSWNCHFLSARVFLLMPVAFPSLQDVSHRLSPSYCCWLHFDLGPDFCTWTPEPDMCLGKGRVEILGHLLTWKANTGNEVQ